jgi:hypothetical protein
MMLFKTSTNYFLSLYYIIFNNFTINNNYSVRVDYPKLSIKGIVGQNDYFLYWIKIATTTTLDKKRSNFTICLLPLITNHIIGSVFGGYSVKDINKMIRQIIAVLSTVLSINPNLW